MKKHTSLILLVIAVAAALLGWKRSGDVAALRQEYRELVRTHSTLPLNAAQTASAAGSAAPADPATAKLEAQLQEIASVFGDMDIYAKRHAIIDWLGAAATTLSTRQLVDLAKAGYRIFPDGKDADEAAAMILQVVYEREHRAALDALLALSPSRIDQLVSWLADWTVESPDAARAWREGAAPQIAGHAELEKAVTLAFENAAARDPAVELPKILSGEGIENETKLRSELARYLTTPAHSRLLLEAIAGVPDAQRQQRLLDSLGKQAAESMTPQRLQEFCATAPLPDSGKLRLCVAAVTRSLDERTPERAGWMLSLCPDTTAKSTAASSLTAAWARQDFNAAGQWINSLTDKADQPVRDAAAATFAEVVSAIEPPAAAAWAQTITDPALRDKSLRLALSSWSLNDRPAALAFLSAKGLPATLLPSE